MFLTGKTWHGRSRQALRTRSSATSAAPWRAASVMGIILGSRFFYVQLKTKHPTCREGYYQQIRSLIFSNICKGGLPCKWRLPHIIWWEFKSWDRWNDEFSETTADGNLFVRDCADAHDGGQVRAIGIYESHSRWSWNIFKVITLILKHLETSSK